ncbi:MAG TPA: hypothetical protein VMT85_00270 [Thermoanaerobaculia bacterium]|nr:hypothetical protein [Thermoanaerobaculia bacterium]
MVLALHQTDAARATLRSLFDYAGLFPPAACTIEQACGAYDRARRSPVEWMLGSFVLPLNRVDELIAERERSGDGATWPVSVLLGAADEDAVARLGAARERWRGRLTLGALEVAPLPPADIVGTARRLPSDVQVFFESPIDSELDARLDAMATAGACAKVRTGGVAVDAFPPVEAVARFLCGCRDRGLPFKATAGLHHALRGTQSVTYEDDSPRTVTHGFLNVALAAMLLSTGRIDDEDVPELLAEESFEAFELGSRTVGWRDQRLTLDEIERSRRSFFCSIGSCSFEEPVGDLTALRVLEAAAQGVGGSRLMSSR